MESLFQIFGNGAVFIREAANPGKSGQPVVKIDRNIQAGNPERTYMDKGFPFLHSVHVHLKIFLTTYRMFLLNGKTEQGILGTDR